MGRIHAPIKIAGPGRCEVTEQGVTVSGFLAKSQGGSVFLFLVSSAAWVALWMTLLPGRGVFANAMIFGGVSAILYGTVLRGRGKHKADKPVEWSIPWGSISGVGPDDQPGAVHFLVKNFKPKGTIHFCPEGGPEAFTAAIKRS